MGMPSVPIHVFHAIYVIMVHVVPVNKWACLQFQYMSSMLSTVKVIHIIIWLLKNALVWNDQHSFYMHHFHIFILFSASHFNPLVD